MQMPLLAVSDHVVWGSAGGSFASYDTELALQRLDGSTRGFASEAVIGSRHNCQRNAVTCTGCSNKLGILAVVDAHLVHLLAVVHTADHLVGLAASILTENQSCHPRGIGVTPAVIAGCDRYIVLVARVDWIGHQVDFGLMPVSVIQPSCLSARKHPRNDLDGM